MAIKHSHSPLATPDDSHTLKFRAVCQDSFYQQITVTLTTKTYMSQEDNWFDKVVKGWERSESYDGVPYYINYELNRFWVYCRRVACPFDSHSSERTSWDHPYYVKIMDEMHEMNIVRYAAYRTGLKLRHLQKRLSLHQVSLCTIMDVCQRGHSGDAVLTIDDLSILVSQIYAKCTPPSHVNGSRLSRDVLSELLLNLLLNLYDPKRTGCVRLACIQIALIIFCSANLNLKYNSLFHTLVGALYYLTKETMNTFLQDLLQIPELLGERDAFSSGCVAAAINSCFELGSNGSGVTEDTFCRWLLKEPQTVLWLPTMHRVIASENVTHAAKCSICKSCPIVGFRYRCLKCFHFDLCQQCFFSGRTTRSHKLKHPIREYCHTISSRDDAKDMVKTIRNKLRGHRPAKATMSYLPIDTGPSNNIRHKECPSIVNPDPHILVLKAATRLEQLSTSLEGDAPPPRNTDPAYSNGTQEAMSKSLQTSMVASVDTKALQTSFSTSDVVRDGVGDGDRVHVGRLLTVIDNLQSENRQLQRALESLRHRASTCSDSDSDSILSYTEELEERREVLEARNEVLQDYNMSLSRQLLRVQQSLKESPKDPPPPEGVPEGVSIALTPSLDSPFPVITPILGTPDSHSSAAERGQQALSGGGHRSRKLPGATQSTPRSQYDCTTDGGTAPGKEITKQVLFSGDNVYNSPGTFGGDGGGDESGGSVVVTRHGDADIHPRDAWHSIDMMESSSGSCQRTFDQSTTYTVDDPQLNEILADMDHAFSDIFSASGNHDIQTVGVNAEMLSSVKGLGDAMHAQFAHLYDLA